MAHKRGLVVSEYDQRDSEMLGDNTRQFSDKDIGKFVTYNGVQCDLCGVDEEIVGVVETVEPYTEQGHSFGTVKKTGRVKAVVEGATPLKVKDLVVAGTQPALGTKGVGAVKAGAPATFKWMVVWLSADGSAGTEVIIERV